MRSRTELGRLGLEPRCGVYGRASGDEEVLSRPTSCGMADRFENGREHVPYRPPIS